MPERFSFMESYYNCLRADDAHRRMNIDQERDQFRAEFRRAPGLYIFEYDDAPQIADSKSASEMTLHEVLICLSNLTARENIYGSMRWAEENGLMAALLERYFELTEEETK